MYLNLSLVNVVTGSHHIPPTKTPRVRYPPRYQTLLKTCGRVPHPSTCTSHAAPAWTSVIYPPGTSSIFGDLLSSSLFGVSPRQMKRVSSRPLGCICKTATDSSMRAGVFIATGRLGRNVTQGAGTGNPGEPISTSKARSRSGSSRPRQQHGRPCLGRLPACH